MRVSVVICTYNRADGLRATLRCLRQQRFPDFEVVVVNGPSTDQTEEVLAEYAGLVKVERNPIANLSMSRNLGIRAAAGDIVAFIDDDALPELCWLDQALPSFDDEGVGGVGGIVFDHTGMQLQYRYSAANRFGEATWSSDEPYDELCVPGAFTFPYLQGTNALFRRSALGRIGLFDETFDYYLDETDACCRVVDAGYVLRQLDVAPVHHKYLQSAVRNEARVITNWYPVVKNHTYFGFRHALHEYPELEVVDRARRFIEHLIEDTRRHEQMGNLPHGQTQRAIERCGPALAAGIKLGRDRHGLRLTPEILDRDDFLPFPTIDSSGRYNIVLVSSGYTPNVTGGIARFISDLAPELARRGHDVRVFAKAAEASTVDLEDGVWVHRLVPDSTPGLLPDGPPHIDGFATAVAREIERVRLWWDPVVVYGSLWDVEVLGIMRTDPVPVVPMLATPTAEVAHLEGWDDPASPNHHVACQIIALEHEVLAGATLVHAISDAIVSTVQTMYNRPLDSERTVIAHIGRSDTTTDTATDEESLHDPRRDPPTVLFIGRLEPRKGIDVFLGAAELLLATGTNVSFVVAGDNRRPGPDGARYPDTWARSVPANRDRLRFVGEVDDDGLDTLIDESTVVVMPSRYESFGLVVVEAMMHGRPAIASAIGGLVELIDDGVTGRLVPPDDAPALAQALSDLLADPIEARAIGVRARQHYLEYLTVEAAAERVEGILRAAIVRSRQPVAVGP
jgi:hypothetical protein